MDVSEDGWIRIPEDVDTGLAARELFMRHSVTGQVYRVYVEDGENIHITIDAQPDMIGPERICVRDGIYRFEGLSWAAIETPFAARNSWCTLTLTTPASLEIDGRLDHEVTDAASLHRQPRAQGET